MIKEALQYINLLKEEGMAPIVQEISGHTYCNKQLNRYDVVNYANKIQTTTLSSIVEYIKGLDSELAQEMILHVESPTRVRLFSSLDDERERETLIESNAIVQEFQFDRSYDQERFIIELQANFEANSELKVLLQVAGNVKAESTANYGDDGVSQKTTIKSGIASSTDVIVPNPVYLVPYRTFTEVEQPASNFVFRIGDSRGEASFRLIEAEGGLWKNEAIRNIKNYFNDRLSDYEGDSVITILG